MEKADHELLLRLVPENNRLRQLYEEHVALENELIDFENCPPYSANSEIRQKELKKQKLRGMDTILRILSDFRNTQTMH